MCGGEVIAKCGKRIVWHWAHKSLKQCDAWWENETEWHRQWKDCYPEEWQEIIHIDRITGERHVADVKTRSGLIIEFQNSPMQFEELRSREEFYNNMIWIVNGTEFRKNFHIMDKIPPSTADFMHDIVFLEPKNAQYGGPFKRISDNNTPSCLQIHFRHEIEKLIEENYVGHHQFFWKRPRSIWYEASKPVYLDLGEQGIWKMEKYGNSEMMCVRAIDKNLLINTTRASGVGSFS